MNHFGGREALFPGLAMLLALATMLCIGSSPVAAHPEGFSGARVRIETDRVHLSLTIHTRDMGRWFPPARFPDYVADVCRSLRSTADELVEVQLDDRVVPHASVDAFQLEPGLLQVDLTYVAPDAPRTLQLWNKHLVFLPRGHQQILIIEDVRGSSPRVLHEGTFSAEEDAVIIDLPQAGDVDVAAHEPARGGGRISFFALGVEHILTGYDHLLFLAALLLVCRNFAQAAAVITFFTIAHSITLALAALDVVRLSPALVEPLIAASIVYVAIENLVGKHRAQWRAGVTFAFGLMHGLGFASVLRDIGLGSTTSGVALPLLSFNLGVEAGQLAVAALLLPVLFLLKRRPVFEQRWVPACSVGVAMLGTYWLVTRVMAG